MHHRAGQFCALVVPVAVCLGLIPALAAAAETTPRQADLAVATIVVDGMMKSRSGAT